MTIHEQHPSMESLAAFAEGRTDREEREGIVQHLSGCRDCYTLVAEAASYLQQEQESVVRPMPPRTASAKSWWLAAAAALLLVTALGFFARTHRRDPLAEIAAAASTSHPLHVRVSGGVAPGAPVLRGSETEGNVDLLRIYVELKQHRRTDDSAQTQHAIGLTALLLGRNDEAIDSLQKAAAVSNDAAMWSDLAAAHEARWEANASSADLDQADALSRRALKIQPGRAESIFDRAQILEAKGDRANALTLWNQYLTLDAASAWSDVARRHVRQLSEPAAGR